MPELPEVESLLDRVRPRLLGRRVCGLRSTWPGAFVSGSPRQASQRLRGGRILCISRRGKYFLLASENGYTLVGHLRMSGCLFWSADGRPGSPWVRHRLLFAGGGELQFGDSRKFGRLWVGRDPGAYLAGLGPEPLGPGWTAGRVARDLAARRRMLKPLLLDQGFVAGLGNIYVDEALHRARLHPLRHSHRLAREEIRRLHRSVRQVLREAIRAGGTSFDGALRARDGRPVGGYQARLRVYGRAGRPCRRCGAVLVRGVVAQRGTTWCPVCQPAPPRRTGEGSSRKKTARRRALE